MHRMTLQATKSIQWFIYIGTLHTPMKSINGYSIRPDTLCLLVFRHLGADYRGFSGKYSLLKKQRQSHIRAKTIHS